MTRPIHLQNAPFVLLLLMLLILAVPPQSGATIDTSYPRLTLWPLASHSASADASTTDILWPLLHHQRRGSEQRWQLRPALLDYTTDSARDYRRFDALLLLTRFERTGDDFWNHIFPIYWHGSQGDKSRWLHLWPLYGQWTKTDGEKGKTTLWPFLQYRSNAISGDFWSHIFPIYWHGAQGDKSRWLHLWPLYGQWTKADGEKGKTTLWPFFQYRNNAVNGDWSADYFFPLGRNWREGDASGGQLLPLWWWRTDPQRSAGFIIPYYWNHRPDKQRDGIFPLWYRKVTPEEQFNQIALYLGYRGPTSRYDALIPLWFDRTKGDQRLQLLLPIGLRSRGADSTTSALLPVWFEHRNPRRSFATLFPFYWRWSGVAAELRLFVPFHGSYHDQETDTSLWFPFYFHHRDRAIDSELSYYFPLYGHYRRGERIDERYYLFPLYAHSADTESGYESWNLLWPLFHYDRTAQDYQAWALPFFWSKRSEEHRLSMALALYWASERAASGFTLLAPLYWSSHNENSSQRHLFPLYNDIQASDGWRKQFFLGPLAILTDDPANGRSQTDILWPLISRQRSPTKEHTRLLPFYWHEQTSTRRLTLGTAALLPPYYVRYEKDDVKMHHLWPFFGVYRHDDYREASILWPLLRRGSSDDGQRSAWHVLLAYGEREGKDYSYGLMPLWMHEKMGDQVKDTSLLHLYRSQEDDGSEFAFVHLGHPEASLLHVENDVAKHHQHLFPLYSYRRDTEQDRTKFSLLWPLFDYQRRGDERSSWRVLWRLLHSEENAERELFEFSPFFYRERAADGELYTAYLGGLFTTLERDGKTERSLLWFLRW